MPIDSSQPSPNVAFVGMHGPPEATGLALRPVDGWDIVIANEEAVAAGRRYMRRNLATAFDDADPNSDIYELRRASELLTLAKDRIRVIDIHDRPDACGEYVQISNRASARALEIAALLGIQDIIVVDRSDTIINHDPNVVIVELCRDGALGNTARIEQNVQRLHRCMATLAKGSVPRVDPTAFNYYEYVTEILATDARALGLTVGDSLKPFDPAPSGAVEILKLGPGEYVVGYWDGACSNPEEYFGEILRKIPCPF